MTKASASDLFLTEGQPPSYRIHGELRRLDQPATERAVLEALLREVAGEVRYARFLETGDLDVGSSIPSGERFRLNASRQLGRLAIVARRVPSGAVDLDGLGLPPVVRRLIGQERGIVLVTGATGSGKSTTLSAMVHAINSSQRKHIVTIEDPIEYIHTSVRGRVSQREVGFDTPSFSEALRHVVRQSPDVIMIGELRDAETMSVAMSAALTGHLVLASLHTIDASQTLQRILSRYPEEQRAQVSLDLALSLKGIVSQRLLPKSDGSGRVLAVEILTNTPAVSTLLRQQRVEEIQDLMRNAEGEEIRTFNHALLEIYRAGQITYEVGYAAASNPDEFALATQGMASGAESFRVGGAAVGDTGLDMKALLEIAIERGASDLHVTEHRPPILRIDGELVPIGDHPLSAADLRVLLFSIMSRRQRSVYELERELDFAIALDDGRRFRVNAYYQKGRMAASLRAIPSRVPSAESFGIPSSIIELGNRPQGLFLVCGPTGSGKSTTLACIVDRINRTRRCRIITVEDPIEYVHEAVLSSVDQREVLSDTLSFAAGLKFILRQDPDVILVGELRDLETIGAALSAAETGHLVLATLHANDAVQASDRIIDVYPPHQQPQARAQLAASMLGVVSQRLLLRRDGVGRIPAFEIMIATTAVRTLIREAKMHQARSAIEASQKDGMRTMDHSILELYRAQAIGYDEALRHMLNPKSLGPRPERAPSLPVGVEEGDELAPEEAAEVSDAPSEGPAKRRFPWSR